MHSKRQYWTIAKVRTLNLITNLLAKTHFPSINANVDPQLSACIKDVDDIEKLLSEVNDDHSKFKNDIEIE